MTLLGQQDYVLGEDKEGNCHSYVTDLCHKHRIKPTKGNIRFLKIAYRINVIKGVHFHRDDYFPMTKDAFRKRIERLRPAVVTDYVSGCGFYRLDGIEVNRNVTLKDREVAKIPDVDPDFEKWIESCEQQPVMMHNLRISTVTEGLYSSLIKNGYKPNEKNQEITITCDYYKIFTTTLNITSKGKVLIMIGCSNRPPFYSLEGFGELKFHLGRVFEELALVHAKNDFIYPPIGSWIVHYLELNQDGIEINAKRFNYTITQLSNHSVFYIKKFQDGTIRPRLESRMTPYKTFLELEELASTEASQVEEN